MPSPPITATRIGAVGSVADVAAVSEVMRGRLVVVGALAAVVPQVERGLDGLVAAGVLGLVAGRTPVGVHVVHGQNSSFTSIGCRVTSRLGAEPAYVFVDRTRRGPEDRERIALCVVPGADPPRSGSSGVAVTRPGTPNSATRWPCSQASPRRSMSTNTLRMMGPRYDARPRLASCLDMAFTMRDRPLGMKDSQA